MDNLACHVFIGGLPVEDNKKMLKKPCHIAVGTPGQWEIFLTMYWMKCSHKYISLGHMAQTLTDLHIFKTATDKMLLRTDYKMSRCRFILMIKNEKNNNASSTDKHLKKNLKIYKVVLLKDYCCYYHWWSGEIYFFARNWVVSLQSIVIVIRNIYLYLIKNYILY